MPSAYDLWERVHRVGLGSNFVPCPELGGHLGLIHVVLERNNPDHPETMDPAHPDIEEQYEGWLVWLDFDDKGGPAVRPACAPSRRMTSPAAIKALGSYLTPSGSPSRFLCIAPATAWKSATAGATARFSRRYLITRLSSGGWPASLPRLRAAAS